MRVDGRAWHTTIDACRNHLDSRSTHVDVRPHTRASWPPISGGRLVFPAEILTAVMEGKGRQHDEAHRGASPDQIPGDGGGRGHVRPARRMHPARLRSPARFLDSSHPRPPRAGRRPHGRGVCPRHRASRGRHGHQRSGGHQHGHAAVRCVHGLDPDGVHHRAGADHRDRHRRVPRVRHRRHHPQRHQAQRAGHDRAEPADGRAPVVPHRHHRPAGPDADRRAEGRAAELDGVVLADRRRSRRQPARLPPQREGPPADDQGGRQVDRGLRATGALRRRRHPEGPRRRGAARAGRDDRHPRRHHVDGPRCVPRRPPVVPRHARHARQRHGDHGAAAQRPVDHARRPLRRSHHRQGVDLRPRRQGHPRRHRPGRAGQGSQARRADRRRLPVGHRRAHPGDPRSAAERHADGPTPVRGRAESAAGASSSRSRTRPASRARR